jgi:hypothetical protein
MKKRILRTNYKRVKLKKTKFLNEDFFGWKQKKSSLFFTFNLIIILLISFHNIVRKSKLYFIKLNSNSILKIYQTL